MSNAVKQKIADEFGAFLYEWCDSIDPVTCIETWVQIYENGFARQKRMPVHDFIEDNQRALNDSAYERFGDGKVTARIPLHEFFADGLDKAFSQQDEAYIRKYLTEHPEFRRFRSVG